MPEHIHLALRRFGMGGLVLAAILAGAGLAGCRSPDLPGPPTEPVADHTTLLPAARRDLLGRREVVDDVPAQVRLLLFAWVAEEVTDESPEIAEWARAQAEDAVRELTAATRRYWLDESDGLLVGTARGRIAVSGTAVAAQHDKADFASRLRRLSERLAVPPEAAAALDECLDERLWPEPIRSEQERFVAWYRDREGSLRLPPLPGLDVVQRDLGQLAAATKVREQLLEGLLAVEELERRRRFPEAMEKLETVLGDPQALEALRTLRDQETPRRLADKRLFLPQAVVSAECEILRRHHAEPLARAAAHLADADHRKNTGERLEILESRLAQRLDEWRDDERFATARRRYAEEVEKLIQTAFTVRLAIWEAELRAADGPLAAWRQFDSLTPWLDSLRDYGGPGGSAYRYLDAGGERGVAPSRNRLRQAENRLLPIYANNLPDTFAVWREFAERQVSLHLRHGIDLAIAARIQEMLAPLAESSLTSSLQDHLGWARQRTLASLERFRINEAGCAVRIEPFAADVAGQGLTWARDLETRLRDILAQTGHQSFATVFPVGEEGESLPRSLLVTRGRVANFGADETSEKASMREVVEVAEPSPVNDGRLQPTYTQTVSRRAIHVVETERVAHIRVGFQIRSNGNGPEDVEVNRFYRRTFVQESSHPFLDMAVVETRRSERRSELAAPSEPLDLRSDRVWTASEMLDWSRRLALDEMAGRVVCRLAAFPLELVNRAQQASQAEDWLAATNAWGYAAAYLGRLEPIRHADPEQPEPPPDIQHRLQQIARWRDESSRRMNEALHRLLLELPSRIGNGP